LRPEGRNLDPEKVWSLSEDDAYGLFVDFRWADNDGKPYCPRCGCLKPYSVRRRRFRCSEPECRAEFSVTSETVFANRKLSFMKIIMAIWEEITAAKGMATLHLPAAPTGQPNLPPPAGRFSTEYHGTASVRQITLAQPI
jgi:hypothetical protein